MSDERRSESRARRRLQRSSGRAFGVRTAAVAVFDALAVYAAAGFAANGSWAVLAMLVLAIALVNWAYLSPRANASRWLTPGLILMAFFVVYPVLYTSYVSLTNWQTGNILTKDQAIDRLEKRSITGAESGESGPMAVYRDDADRLALVVSSDSVAPYAGLLRPAGEPVDPAEAFAVDPAFDFGDPPVTVEGFELLERLALTGVASRLEDGEVDLPDGRVARVETLGSFRLVTGGPRYRYDAATDTLADTQLGLACAAGEGTFFCDDVPRSEVGGITLADVDSGVVCSGERCDNVPLFAIDSSAPGWREVVGGDNYADLIGNERIRGPFLRVLAWNIVFAFGSVLLTFALGLGLAILVENEAMRGRNIYRSIFIVPYAVPPFLSILIWRGLLGTEFGKVNDLIATFGIPRVDWLGNGVAAMISVLFVNMWLGFPYMFLITSGALTSVPKELLEAARVDGAGPWRSFRTITLPLLLVSTAPLLIGSFAFNFNNFLLIFLLTNGGPPLTGYDIPVGSTDLLISFTFDLAQASGRGQQFGLATAIVVVIFLVLATSAAFSFRLTKRLEEIYDQ